MMLNSTVILKQSVSQPPSVALRLKKSVTHARASDLYGETTCMQ